MLRINNLKISILHSKVDLIKKIVKTLKIKESDILSYKIKRQSLDARKKEDILYSYNIDVELKKEDIVLKKHKNNINIFKAEDKKYKIEAMGDKKLNHRIIVVGFGPAGIFAALSLSRAGFKPLIIERGEDIDRRSISVDKFWKDGILNEESNVCFGEGGAGAFSDGKLNTLVKDLNGRNTFVLETLVEHGADKRILYDYKPHIGTDKLKDVVKNIRKEILSLGGEIKFNTCMKEIICKDNEVQAVKLNNDEIIKTNILILACGHSARDTFYMLNDKKVDMKAKKFAVGIRVIHSQKNIDKAQFGNKFYEKLSPAPYKLTCTTSNNRAVYSFCMCPGGYVINSSSDKNHLLINGMSYNDRASGFANSAIIVAVDENDFKNNDLFAGMHYQEELEKLCYKLAKGKIPIQLYKDFIKNETGNLDNIKDIPIKGAYVSFDLNEILPDYISTSIKEAFIAFDKKIKGFACDDAILLGVETRTSSPIRINRGDDFQANIKGLFPCGEGAGYAGGITSAAMDGLKIAEFINKTYKV